MQKHLFHISIILCFFSFSYIFTNAQFSGVKWQRKFLDSMFYRGDWPPIEALRKVIHNDKNETFVIGRHGPPNQKSFLLGSNTITKFSNDKSVMWKAGFGDVWYDFDHHVADVLEVVPAGDGGVVALTVNESAKFGVDLPPGIYDLSEYADIYICKFSNNGTMEWETTTHDR